MKINSFEEYEEAYKKSVESPEDFWGEIAANNFEWKKPWEKVLNWNFNEPKIEWFVGGKLNITENCLDRHVKDKPNQPAIIWEPNDPNEESIILTYRQLFERVCRFANVLKRIGVQKGDRVCIYMPMIPELSIAVLACARIGAIHSVVFGGFSATSIADRINDSQCVAVVTTDGAVRGNKDIPMKDTVDDAMIGCPSVKKVIVATRTRTPVSMIKGRDVWWEEEEKHVTSDCPAEEMDSEDPLFILYTSGSTGKPKGVVQTCGGYMVYAAYTFQNVFQYKPGMVHFCTADIGWITGHSYIVYGPLASGAISVLFEGVPTYPDAGRFWDIVEKHKVNILYTAPTAIRSLMGFGLEYVDGKDLSSLKVLGSVGEPINEEAWQWYSKNIGKDKCPVVDTWWQTETGGIMISALAGITPLKPAWASLPLPGVLMMLVDEQGNEIVGGDVSGNLCIKFPWPSILRTTWGDHERCRTNYFSAYPNL
jgi:acetyl-CoA synthetase